MAATSSETSSGPFSTRSHDTALCILPPTLLWSSYDRIRIQHDKAYGKWAPHINLVYPFVSPDALPRAADQIASALPDSLEPITLCLDEPGVFEQKLPANLLFVHDSNPENRTRLKDLRKLVLGALSQKSNNFTHHLTLAQTEDFSDKHHFLKSKIGELPSPEWTVDKLYILARERIQLDGTATSRMKVWGTIDLATRRLEQLPVPQDMYAAASKDDAASELGAPDDAALFSGATYRYSVGTRRWESFQPETVTPEVNNVLKNLSVASYNVLAEFIYPPTCSRFRILADNIFDRSAQADILVLQEVTDSFLSYLLTYDATLKAFPYVSHGPPSQADIDPLPNHVNNVVLSKYPFTWSWTSLKRKHKGSIVATFPTIGRLASDGFIPLVLATVHLTCGLTDTSVASKKVELNALLSHLSTNYPHNPWILAGDFNMSTSSYTIEHLVNNKTIESKTASSLAGLETTLAEAKLADSWMVAHLERGYITESEDDEGFQGEQGATYDPLKNLLAKEIVGSGFNCRPQRYDRILVRSQGLFKVTGFNMFGFATKTKSDCHDDLSQDGQLADEPLFASDHWGVRCELAVTPEDSEQRMQESAHVAPVKLEHATGSLEDPEALTQALSTQNVFPSEADITQRKDAVDLLRQILLENPTPESDQPKTRFAEVLIPVGSYGLGVWSPKSDVDCMVIGHTSSKTFFMVAAQRLRKAGLVHDVKILRRVNARSGTMLELSILGVRMDLQYCAAPAIAESWPKCLRLSNNDPIFGLAPQTLMKLKAARDLQYAKSSVPDLSIFRTAYRAVKEWASSRGLYAARFGYLGGIHISVLLARVHKILASEATGSMVSVTDLLVSFFEHYATFDWKKDTAFDPFFHRRLRYPRSHQREPLVILGWYPPQLNTAHAATVSSIRTLAMEFERAAEMLQSQGMTWERFLGREDAAREFTKVYKSYVKINVQYWGLSLEKGSSLVGWLESRCVALIVDLNYRLPNIHARVWPGRFVESTGDGTSSATGDGEEQREYQGCYLIGLDRLGDRDSMSKDEEEKAHGSLLAVLRRFTESIRADTRFYDSNWAWIDASVIRGSKVGNLVLDEREWGAYVAPDDGSEDDEEEEEEEEEEGFEEDSWDMAKKSKKKEVVVRASKPASAGKFRTSIDVMNRLRWDPSLDSGDYLVGYEDRFVGVKERSLDLWKGEQTDEEFIPQHRVVYFKRKTDGAIVWDRRTRKDEIFGSG